MNISRHPKYALHVRDVDELLLAKHIPSSGNLKRSFKIPKYFNRNPWQMLRNFEESHPFIDKLFTKISLSRHVAATFVLMRRSSGAGNNSSGSNASSSRDREREREAMDPIAELLSQLSGVRRGLSGVSGSSGLGSVLGLGALGSLGGALGSLGGKHPYLY